LTKQTPNFGLVEQLRPILQIQVQCKRSFFKHKIRFAFATMASAPLSRSFAERGSALSSARRIGGRGTLSAIASTWSNFGTFFYTHDPIFSLISSRLELVTQLHRIAQN
jgi:hypothetical protein